MVLTTCFVLALATVPQPWDEFPSAPKPVARGLPSSLDTEQTQDEVERLVVQFEQQRRELAADRAALARRLAQPEEKSESSPAPNLTKLRRKARTGDVEIITGPVPRRSSPPPVDQRPSPDTAVELKERALAQKEAELQRREAELSQRAEALEAELTKTQEAQRAQTKAQAAKRRALEQQAERLDELLQSAAEGLGSR